MTPSVIEIIHRIVKIDSLDYLRGMDGEREMFLHFWVEIHEGYYKPFTLDESFKTDWLKAVIAEGKVYVSEERYLEKKKV